MSAMRDAKAPLRILICALGGEGGGVLMNWIVAAARAAGYCVQATSVPGVAQRTGATSYYVEIAEGGTAPVFSLVPMPGRVDVVLASELVEAARVMEGGFVSPGLTTLIASTSRVYSTAEKIAMGDGRFDEEAIRTAAGTLAKTVHLPDLQALATQHGTFVSATLFGALAGSGVLPWPAEISKGVLGTGRSAEASLRGMEAAMAVVRTDRGGVGMGEGEGGADEGEGGRDEDGGGAGGSEAGSGAPLPDALLCGMPGAESGGGLSGAEGAAGLPGAEGADRLPGTGGADSAEGLPGTEGAEAPPGAKGLPASLAEVIGHGRARVLDFQDERYAALYAERVGTLLAGADLRDPQALHAVTEAGRRLALWMAYEDVARVADLKTRHERFRRIRSESRMQPGQILRVTEYLKPRAEEVADAMPVGIGRRIMARVEAGKGFPLLGRGIHVRSNGALGYWMLRSVASLKRIRRRSLRYHREQQSIEEWLRAFTAALPASAAFAGALAELPRLRKGYSDTMQRGLAAYSRIMEAIVRPALSSGAPADHADRLRKAVAAAMADERHAALDALLAGEDALSDGPDGVPDGRPDGVPVPFSMPERKPKEELVNVH